MPEGTIKHYSDDLGHGMITPSDQSRDVFFNRHVVEGGLVWLAPGVKVTYELFDGDGSPQAKSVKRRD